MEVTDSFGPRDQLAALLRPAGGGLFVVSTGKAEQLAIQRALYGAADETAIARAHAAAIERLATARGFILGVPSDVGAGYRRGANLAPQAIRGALLAADPGFRGWLERNRIVDLGDVFVIPHLLHDDMVSPAQLAASRAAIYPSLPPALAAQLPVSPLSIEARVLACAYAINPNLVPFVLGGDHSVAWPVAEALAAHRNDRFSIVQPDAHTDLMSERLGVKYCFATWSYHANELLGRDGRMVQVGVRASGRDQAHWENTLGVRQFWAETILRAPDQALDDIIAHLRSVGTTSVYFSNDIDGTGSEFAPSAGTPEPDGLTPDWVVALIDRLGSEFGLCAADCVEVAPPLGPTAEGTTATVALAARYTQACLRQIART